MPESIYEVGYEEGTPLAHFVENYSDDERGCCRDPFDIVAELEEELGYPLALS